MIRWDFRLAILDGEAKSGGGPILVALRVGVGDAGQRAGTPIMTPKTCCTKSGELSIAYQVVRQGPFDVVFVPGFVSNVDQGWEMPVSTLYRRLSSFSRLIIFYTRGTRLTDRNCGIPSLEERIDDVRAAMAAVCGEPDVTVSRHPVPIRQTPRSYRAASAQRVPHFP